MVDIFWKTEVIGKLYYVRSGGENVGGSAVGIFWITQVLGKMYYVPSADEDVGGSVVDILRKTEAIAICSTYGSPPKRGWYGGCFFIF